MLKCIYHTFIWLKTNKSTAKTARAIEISFDATLSGLPLLHLYKSGTSRKFLCMMLSNNGNRDKLMPFYCHLSHYRQSFLRYHAAAPARSQSFWLQLVREMQAENNSNNTRQFKAQLLAYLIYDSMKGNLPLSSRLRHNRISVRPNFCLLEYSMLKIRKLCRACTESPNLIKLLIRI